MLHAGRVNLQQNLYLKIEENTENVRVDLTQDPVAYPEPGNGSFLWSKGSVRVTSGPTITLTYSTITFTTVMRSHAGRYVVFAAPFYKHGESHRDQPGKGYGSLILDVICKSLWR